MEKKESSKAKDMKNQNFVTKKLNTSSKSKTQNDKNLPWWVELLFVQIGLPDKFLVKILKSKRNFNDLIKSEKKFIISSLFFIGALVYFYPVIKYSKTKIDCESNAKTYIVKNKQLKKINKKDLRVLSTNFCNGGDEISEIMNIK